MSYRKHRRPFVGRGLRVVLLLALVILGLGQTGSAIAGSSAAGLDLTLQQGVVVSGNINPDSIQIDSSANLFYSASDSVLRAGSVDWVKDSQDNTGSDCLDNSIATCNQANVTAASGGTGHWNGVRIVDGVGNGDQDIFVKGGKENDVSTWTIEAGSVGSSKYDITEAYLANNQTTLFFGMERRGNNGTTEYEFEFNAKPPLSTYIPDRSVGDVLFVFEMQGSGTSGSATPSVFKWNGTGWVVQSGTALGSSINTTTNTPAGPWGFVDSKGDWTTGYLDRFTFAEAYADLTSAGLPGVDTCGGHAFVEVRTRASMRDGSDLKDTTKIFEYVFGDVTVEASLTPSCNAEFGFSAQAKSTDGTNVPDGDATYAWSCNAGAVTFSGKSGTHSASAGLYNCTVTATQTSTSCSATSEPASVNVFAPLSVTADAVPSCTLDGEANTYAGTVTGGSSSVSHAWTGTGVSFSASTSASGTYDVASAGTYTLTDTVTDLRTDLPAGSCTASDSDQVRLSTLTVDASMTSTCDLTVPFSGTVNGAIGTTSTTWVITGPTAVSGFNASDASGIATVAAPGGTYSGTFTATDLRSDVGNPAVAAFECTANVSKSAEAFGPISVTIAPDATGLTCPALDSVGTDVTYTASASGGKGPYTYTWNVTGENSAAACGDSASCLVDFLPGNFCGVIDLQVTADDSSSLCSPKSSESETVTRVTAITATNQ